MGNKFFGSGKPKESKAAKSIKAVPFESEEDLKARNLEKSEKKSSKFRNSRKKAPDVSKKDSSIEKSPVSSPETTRKSSNKQNTAETKKKFFIGKHSKTNQTYPPATSEDEIIGMSFKELKDTQMEVTKNGIDQSSQISQSEAQYDEVRRPEPKIEAIISNETKTEALEVDVEPKNEQTPTQVTTTGSELKREDQSLLQPEKQTALKSPTVCAQSAQNTDRHSKNEDQQASEPERKTGPSAAVGGEDEREFKVASAASLPHTDPPSLEEEVDAALHNTH